MLVKANGKEYVVKFKYGSKLITKTKIDKYGRRITAEWIEKTTTCIIKILGNEDTNVSGIGVARCSYKDNFEKAYGREYSFVRALNNLEGSNNSVFSSFIEQYNSVFKKKIVVSDIENYFQIILKGR
jgi:hypothetical protein